jgi:hypothetical protein
MTMSLAVKDGVPSMRFETHDSASMLFRHVDIDLAAYPMLAWRWYIELPIRSPLDERARRRRSPGARFRQGSIMKLGSREERSADTTGSSTLSVELWETL